ncbi:MAG: DUF1049 domain-containing protein [Gammaproteobacteria bacterium CG_4_10_14_0_8_um_filter_38_16]|nr:MAG: DUF1049 domain-containing protein [Gammaproteobacteria bacterium CG_4_10_14_0_8_um_filter_38_16]PJA04195.1 MAG: DUF1049 domain-containing protein [Gammaproteobacteria bacterium CG_4_10_14_0_2_um_filter_38_22]PJB11031.1 MAG: DUF1049 domain-containing protein [Gammaproteobacteria bacterium CG_4_9_14_3_um_filter_38_9]
MRFIFYFFYLFFIILGASFAILNSYNVSFNYFVAEKTIYFPLLFLLLLFVGMLLGVMLMLPTMIKLKAQLCHARH